MASSDPAVPRGRDAPEPEPVAEGVLDLLESIQEPAFVCLPGGRIAGVNRALSRRLSLSMVGMTIGEVYEQTGARHPDGTPLVRSDLPSTRALRGEIVAQGERIDLDLPDGSAYRALVTSTPIVIGGTVAAALIVWTDFDAYARRLTGGSGAGGATRRE